MNNTLHKKLIDIQQRLKVPKDQENTFGGFQYRNLEDIEDKVKPLLKEHELTLIFGDEIIAVGERVYVKATASLSDGKDMIENFAYAREAVTPKAKTDDAQLTGACSSYARKYAASGLFLIDNTKDADSMDTSKGNKSASNTSSLVESTATNKPRYATMGQIELMVNKAKWGLNEFDKDIVVNWLGEVLKKSLNEVRMDEMDEALLKIDKALREQKVANKVEATIPEEQDTVVDLTPEEVENGINDLTNIPYQKGENMKTIDNAKSTVKQNLETTKTVWNNFVELLEAACLGGVSGFAIYYELHRDRNFWDQVLLFAGLLIALRAFTLFVKALNKKNA